MKSNIKKQLEGQEDVASINNIIMKEFSSILGSKVQFDVSNIIIDEKREAPLFCPKTLNHMNTDDKIILAMDSYSYWSQLIFQLSHELTHYVIYVINNKNSARVNWIEETMCEAISLYFLRKFTENWKECDLSKENPKYDESIKEYLEKILNDKLGTNALENCQTLDELEKINQYAEIDRKLRKNEMIKLYEKLDRDNIKGLLHYRNYTCGLLLESERYNSDFERCEAVEYICSISDKIKVKNRYK